MYFYSKQKKMPKAPNTLDNFQTEGLIFEEGISKLRTNLVQDIFMVVFMIGVSISVSINTINDLFVLRKEIFEALGLFFLFVVFGTYFFKSRIEYIYAYSIDSGVLKLKMVNIFRQIEELLIPINKVRKIRYIEKGGFWGPDWGTIKIYLNHAINEPYFFELYFFEDVNVDELFEQTGLEELKTPK